MIQSSENGRLCGIIDIDVFYVTVGIGSVIKAEINEELFLCTAVCRQAVPTERTRGFTACGYSVEQYIGFKDVFCSVFCFFVRETNVHSIAREGESAVNNRAIECRAGVRIGCENIILTGGYSVIFEPCSLDARIAEIFAASSYIHLITDIGVIYLI